MADYTAWQVIEFHASRDFSNSMFLQSVFYSSVYQNILAFIHWPTIKLVAILFTLKPKTNMRETESKS